MWVITQAKSPAVKLLYWHEETAPVAAQHHLHLVYKDPRSYLWLHCQLFFEFSLSCNTQSWASCKHRWYVQLSIMVCMELLILFLQDKTTYCYTQDQSWEFMLLTQLTAGQYREGNSTQLRNAPTGAQSGWLESCEQYKGAKQLQIQLYCPLPGVQHHLC